MDFRIFCDNRMKRLIAANTAKSELTFQIFDVRKGEVATHVVTYPGGKKTTASSVLSPSPFQAVTKAHYDRTVSGGETHFHFKEGQSDKMSILDIYTAVQSLGAASANELMELSFFSHAWMGGPILVNSFDDGIVNVAMPLGPPIAFPMPSGARDPDDNDPWAAKDFISPTMDAAALTNFKNAFHSDAFVWIWGCAFPRLVHEILHKVERNAAYKDSGLGDDTVFTIKNFNVSQADLLEKWIKTEMSGPFPDKKNIVIEFKFLKYFFCKITAASYTQHIAKNAANPLRRSARWGRDPD